jgi:hypothetical protein
MPRPTLVPIQTDDGSKKFVSVDEAISERETAMRLVEEAMSELSPWRRKWESVLSAIDGRHPTEATKACAEVIQAMAHADQTVREVATRPTD